MICDAHKRSGGEIAADAARGVRDEKNLRAHGLHKAHGQHNVVRRVAFVEVHATLHDDDGRFLHIAEHEPSGVARRGGHRETGDLAVRHNGGLLHHVGKAAETGAEHDGDLRDKVGVAPHRGETVLDAFHFGMHKRASLCCFSLLFILR